MALIKDKYSTGDILTAVDMNEIVGQVIDNGENVSKKVDIDQGTENAGKALVINEEGKVAVGIAAQPVDKTLKNDGEAADAKVVGNLFDEHGKVLVSLAESTKGIGDAVVDLNKDLGDLSTGVGNVIGNLS